MYEVYYEITDTREVERFCFLNGIPIPELYRHDIESGKVYYKSDISTFERLYISCPFAVLGCYPLN